MISELAILASSVIAEQSIIRDVFFIKRNGGLLVADRQNDIEPCFDVIVSRKQRARVKKRSMNFKEPIRLSLKEEKDYKINPPTLASANGEIIVSSSAWIKYKGKQVFLQCSVDKVYRAEGPL